MPELDLSRALRIGHMGHEVTQLGHLGQTVWTAAAASPVISITSGSGYAGSVYSSTVAGQWTADGVAIAGATGTAWTMTAAYEGKAIRCGASNVIQMWTPAALTTGVIWADPKWSQVVAKGRIAALPNRLGGVGLSNPTASGQPVASDVGGYPCAVFDGSSLLGLYAASQISIRWVVIVGQYRTGSDASFAAVSPVIGAIGATDLVIRANRYGNSWWTISDSVTNGVQGAAVIPGRSIWSATPYGAPAAGQWGIGLRGRDGSTLIAATWDGAIGEVLMLSAAPDTTTRQLIEGCMAWRNGLAGALPTDHPYRTIAPRIA